MSHANTLGKFRSDVAAGGVTLVLGAGVSMSRGVPSWGRLVAALWKRAFGRKPVPAWVTGGDEAPHPLALQILLEEIEASLRGRAKRSFDEARRKERETGEPPPKSATDFFAVAERQLVRWITKELYADLRPAAGRDTLAVLAEVLRNDQRQGSPLVQRVITFNADDLLERETNDPGTTRSAPVLWTISRPSQKPRRNRGAHDMPPISVYHPHGFLPQRKSEGAAPDVLVFTDAQYWESVSRSNSFSNRVVTNALYDSNCIFIGLSMTDVNLMRWLGLRHGEVFEDKRVDQRLKGRTGVGASRSVLDALQRHYWIRPKGDPTGAFISDHLFRRGVRTVTIEGWGEPFDELIGETFRL